MAASDVPQRSGMLTVPVGQRIYWEEWGNPHGLPAVYLHGGPGGGLRNSAYRNHFDLERFRVIGFDQRGCGRSTPHAADISVTLQHNTTAHLIADMERLREHLSIERWVVNGASWGTTLALAYAQQHPDRVLGLVLVAVNTTSRSEVDWITEGVRAIFPEAWDRLATYAEQAGIGYLRGRDRLITAYAALTSSVDQSIRDEASRQWVAWEDAHVSIGSVSASPSRWGDAAFRLAFARLTTHYWNHDGFCVPPLLDGMDRLHAIPGHLIHGRRDISSPALTAWRLHRAWPGSTLYIDEGAGHGGGDMATRWREANRQIEIRDR